MKWRPTPETELITARRMVGGGWEPCRLEELQPGDVFRAVGPDGSFVHPATGEVDEAYIARVAGHPIKNNLNQAGAPTGAQGYAAPIDVYPSTEELKRKGLC